MLEKVGDEDKMNVDPTGTGSERSGEDDDEFGVEEEDGLEDFDFGGGAFSSLNATLDQLQGALDNLESRNAGIHEELLQLLQSNRDVRRGLAEEREKFSGNDSKTNSETEDKTEESSSSTPASTSSRTDTESKTFAQGTSSGSVDSPYTNDQTLASIPELLQAVTVNENGDSRQ